MLGVWMAPVTAQLMMTLAMDVSPAWPCMGGSLGAILHGWGPVAKWGLEWRCAWRLYGRRMSP